jgi:hypothetical protein
VGLRQALWGGPLRFGRLVPNKSSTVLRCARLLGAPRQAVCMRVRPWDAVTMKNVRCRCDRPSSGCQCVVQQLDAGRAERIDLECLFNILLVPLFNALALGVRKEFLCRTTSLETHDHHILPAAQSERTSYGRRMT